MHAGTLQMLVDVGCGPDLQSVKQKHRSGATTTGEGHLSARLMIHTEGGIFMLNIFCN